MSDERTGPAREADEDGTVLRDLQQGVPLHEWAAATHEVSHRYGVGVGEWCCVLCVYSVYSVCVCVCAWIVYVCKLCVECVCVCRGVGGAECVCVWYVCVVCMGGLLCMCCV